MRVQKYLSEKGILSRRKAEEYIKRGWVYVNGSQVTELGTRINPETDVVTLAEQGQEQQRKTVTIVFHKPRGIVTNCPQAGEKQITDILPKSYQHLHSVGRLDKDSEGLILLTDDGILAKTLLDPAHPHEREYIVTVDKPLTPEARTLLEKGVYIQSYRTKQAKVTSLTATRFRIIMTEGKNRQIRRMTESVGLTVTRLQRVRFGPIRLDNLPPGHFRILDKSTISLLKDGASVAPSSGKAT